MAASERRIVWAAIKKNFVNSLAILVTLQSPCKRRKGDLISYAETTFIKIGQLKFHF